MNVLESQLRTMLEQRGWTVYSNGWPDFLCYRARDARTFAVEVKAPRDKLRPNQVAVHELLIRNGIHVAVGRPEAAGIKRVIEGLQNRLARLEQDAGEMAILFDMIEPNPAALCAVPNLHSGHSSHQD